MVDIKFQQVKKALELLKREFYEFGGDLTDTRENIEAPIEQLDKDYTESVIKVLHDLGFKTKEDVETLAERLALSEYTSANVKTNDAIAALQKNAPEFYEIIVNLHQGTFIELKEIKGLPFTDLDIYVLRYEIDTKVQIWELELFKQRIKDMTDEGNPAPSIIEYFGTVIVTVTGFH